MEIYHRKAAPASAPIRAEVKVSESLIKDFTLEAK
jgi:hypothetical protein